jgi:hypothetical protein
LREYNGGEVLRVQRVSIKRKIKSPAPLGRADRKAQLMIAAAAIDRGSLLLPPEIQLIP